MGSMADILINVLIKITWILSLRLGLICDFVVRHDPLDPLLETGCANEATEVADP